MLEMQRDEQHPSRRFSVGMESILEEMSRQRKVGKERLAGLEGSFRGNFDA